MKWRGNMRIFFGIGAVLLFSYPVYAENNIRMVTYFPVPYVSYNDLEVVGTCDAGLMDVCNLEIGNELKFFTKNNDSRDLNTGSLIVQTGKLELNSDLSESVVDGVSIFAGETSSEEGVLEFAHNLEVANIDGDEIQSAQAQNIAYLENMTLFGEEFPYCDASGNEISWQELTINGENGVFLVCGTGESYEVSCEDEPEQEKCCSGCETWDGSSCVQKTCSSGYELNESTCQCEATEDDDESVTAGVWEKGLSVSGGWRCDSSCNIIFDPEDASYNIPQGSCSPIGKVRYVVNDVMDSVACSSLGSGIGKL